MRIYGWRVWNAFPDGILRSPYIDSRSANRIGTPWPRRHFISECPRPKADHVPPGLDCSCGVYADPESELVTAADRLHQIHKKIGALPGSSFPPFHVRPQCVIGKIELRGNVLLDKTLVDPRINVSFPELRGERAKVEELWTPQGSPQWFTDALAKRYRVPVDATPFPETFATELPDLPVVRSSNSVVIPRGGLNAFIAQMKELQTQAKAEQ